MSIKKNFFHFIILIIGISISFYSLGKSYLYLFGDSTPQVDISNSLKNIEQEKKETKEGILKLLNQNVLSQNEKIMGLIKSNHLKELNHLENKLKFEKFSLDQSIKEKQGKIKLFEKILFLGISILIVLLFIILLYKRLYFFSFLALIYLFFFNGLLLINGNSFYFLNSYVKQNDLEDQIKKIDILKNEREYDILQKRLKNQRILNESLENIKTIGNTTNLEKICENITSDYFKNGICYHKITSGNSEEYSFEIENNEQTISEKNFEILKSRQLFKNQDEKEENKENKYSGIIFHNEQDGSVVYKISL